MSRRRDVLIAVGLSTLMVILLGVIVGTAWLAVEVSPWFGLLVAAELIGLMTATMVLE